MLGDKQESRRARPAVEIFIAAADGEVGAGPVEIETKSAGAVRQVPDRQRALGMRGSIERSHVMPLAAAKIGVRQIKNRCVLIDRHGQLAAIDGAQVQLRLQVDEALRNIK